MSLPFDHTVRMSPKAKRCRIVVRPDLSVEVVLPKGADRSRAQQLLMSKQKWVERSLLKFSNMAAIADRESKPKLIELPAIGQHLAICYEPLDADRVRVSEFDGGLKLSGEIDRPSLVAEALRQWLKRKGIERLGPMLSSLADQYDFEFGRLSVRLQRGRWGSCSRDGNISLNAKLLLLPPVLVRYVMIHELAHLKWMDHSPRFWNLVEDCDPDFRIHRRRLRRMAMSLPFWLNG